VLEAMSCGLPVIAYDTKGPKDIIENGKNGYLVKTRADMALAIDDYLADRKRRSRFKRSALSRAKDFNPDTIIAQFLSSVRMDEAPRKRMK
jgi:glycosyltransferase involved in cell wall biosynthesis